MPALSSRPATPTRICGWRARSSTTPCRTTSSTCRIGISPDGWSRGWTTWRPRGIRRMALFPKQTMSERPESITGNYEIALNAATKGHVCIPILAGTKTPAVKWKRWQTEKPTEELYWYWFGRTRHSISIITSGMVVFDCDDLSKVELVLEQCGDTTHKLRTPHGIPLGYR